MSGDIVERATKALEGVTPGEWLAKQSVAYPPKLVLLGPPAAHRKRLDRAGAFRETDARFIAFARTGVPELLDEVKRLREGIRAACAAPPDDEVKHPTQHVGWVLDKLAALLPEVTP